MTKGIRGAITVENNSEAALKTATIELLNELFKQNNIIKENISHIIFTTTNDLNAAFPAKFARKDMGLTETAMMCFHEIDVPNSLRMCLRILIVYNCEKDFIPQFVYLKGAEILRV
jgi:monofunctional chorismate mutase